MFSTFSKIFFFIYSFIYLYFLQAHVYLCLLPLDSTGIDLVHDGERLSANEVANYDITSLLQVFFRSKSVTTRFV